MSNELLNYFEEHAGSTGIRFNKSMSLRDAQYWLIELATRAGLPKHIIDAALLIPALSTKRVNLHVKLSLAALQQLSSPEAVRLAALYASVNNPNQDLWSSEPPYAADHLHALRCIDTLYGLASELPTDDHVTYGEQHGMVTRARDAMLKDIETKRFGALKGQIEGHGVRVQLHDPQIMIYLAQLAFQPHGVHLVYGVDAQGGTVAYHLTPELAKQVVLRWNERFINLHLEHIAALARVDDGTYDFDFNFTPLA